MKYKQHKLLGERTRNGNPQQFEKLADELSVDGWAVFLFCLELKTSFQGRSACIVPLLFGESRRE